MKVSDHYPIEVVLRESSVNVQGEGDESESDYRVGDSSRRSSRNGAGTRSKILSSLYGFWQYLVNVFDGKDKDIAEL